MEQRKDYEIAADDFAVLTQELALDVSAGFVPFSQSRNAGEKFPSLNWRCTVTRRGKPISGLAVVDYMQGSGFAPASKKQWQSDYDKRRALSWECETGKRCDRIGAAGVAIGARPIERPKADDVLQSLCRDSDVLDYPEFEQWAAELGFDPDSRKGEAIYRLCLAQALALRAAIGDAQLAKLCALAAEM